jgi:hypothetical protein
MAKKFIFLIILAALTINCRAQMQAHYGVFKGVLPYVFWDSPNTNKMVVIAQGAGEYAKTFNTWDVPLSTINSADTYATHAKKGVVFPFDILVAASYKPAGKTGNPIQTYLMANLSELIKTFKPSKVVGTGYSYGGQFMAGMMTDSRNSDGKPVYIGGDVFNGFVIIAGKAPGTPNWQIYKSVDRVVVHGTADTAVPFGNGQAIVYRSRDVGFEMPQNYAYVYKPVYAEDGKTKIGMQGVWELTGRDLSNASKFLVLPNAGHGASWQNAYNMNTAVGGEVMKSIMKMLEDPTPPPFVAIAEADTVKMEVRLLLANDTLTYKLCK